MIYGVNISFTGNLKQASLDLSAKATKVLFSLNSKNKEYSTLNAETLNCWIHLSVEGRKGHNSVLLFYL